MRESERYQFIDVLRGIAVLLVLIIHISELYVGFAQQGKAGGRWIAEIAHQFDFGRMGVYDLLYNKWICDTVACREEDLTGA